jgi:hypothetical protein
MKDEERAEYWMYRRERDIVHGKGGNPPPPRPKPEGEKEKKPFQDRVLDKALEHLRGEIQKVGQAPAPPEVHNA